MIILYFDDRYFKWARLLIESLAIHEPTEKIMAFGYNLLPSQKEKTIAFSSVKSFIEMEGVKTKEPLDEMTKQKSLSKQETHVRGKKSKMFNALVKQKSLSKREAYIRGKKTLNEMTKQKSLSEQEIHIRGKETKTEKPLDESAKLLSDQKACFFKFTEKSMTNKQRKYRKNGARGLLIGKKAWYVEKAFKAFPNEGMYLLIDADMLLLRPLTVFKRKMKKHDLAGSFSISKKQLFADGTKKIKIGGGFLAFRPTSAIKRLLREWNKILANDWTENQPSLARLYRKHKDSIRFLDINRWKYMDASSNEDSVLWSAHKAKSGAKKERYEVYLAKLQRMKNEKNYK